MSKCKYCGYILPIKLGNCCEYCRVEYGKMKAKHAQGEHTRIDYSEADLEEMTDGDFINTFGHGMVIKVKDEVEG